MIPKLNETYNTGTSCGDNHAKYGSSDFVPYIPLFALYKQSESIFTRINGELQIIWFHKYPLNGSYSIGNTYKAVMTAYTKYINPVVFTNKQGVYFIRKGIIYTDSFEILLVVCVDKTKLSSIDKQSEPNPQDFITIVNKELFKPRHKLLATRIQKLIINTLLTDIIHTDNPDKYCFKVSNIIPNFDTISDMKNHLNSINEKLCLHQKET